LSALLKLKFCLTKHLSWDTWLSDKQIYCSPSQCWGRYCPLPTNQWIK